MGFEDPINSCVRCEKLCLYIFNLKRKSVGSGVGSLWGSGERHRELSSVVLMRRGNEWVWKLGVPVARWALHGDCIVRYCQIHTPHKPLSLLQVPRTLCGLQAVMLWSFRSLFSWAKGICRVFPPLILTRGSVYWFEREVGGRDINVRNIDHLSPYVPQLGIEPTT